MQLQQRVDTNSCLGLLPPLPLPFSHYHDRYNILKIFIPPSINRNPSLRKYIFSGKMIISTCFLKFPFKPHSLPTCCIFWAQ